MTLIKKLKYLRYFGLVAFFVFSGGCSTVDKRISYEVEGKSSNLVSAKDDVYACTVGGPGGPILTLPFSLQRDILKNAFKFENNIFHISISVHLKNEFTSYWWGPLWVPIVPIFLFKSPNENNLEVGIYQEKEMVNKYDPAVKRSWPAAQEELKNTKLPKISKVILNFTNEKAESVYETKEIGLTGQASQFRDNFEFSLKEKLPENMNVSVYIEDQVFNFRIMKNQSWMYGLYLFGCVQ